MPPTAHQALLFGAVHNVGLFSSHWLEHRLELEPEWQELRGLLGTTGIKNPVDDLAFSIIEFG